MLVTRSWSCVLAGCLLLVALTLPRARAYPRYQPNYLWSGAEGLDQLDPDEIADMINRLSNIIQIERSNTKRGLDLGLSRGYSGALQAKHLMGLAAANFADGPGRRRRDAGL